jgi:transposase
MRCVRDVLRLHFASKHSPRVIAKSLGCGRTTAQDYIARAKKNDLTNWELIEKLTDQELEIRLGFKSFAHATWQNEKKVMPEWLTVHRELQANKNVTLMLLCQEYLEENPRGYQYTQFCEHYNRWSRKLSVVMRQAHKAGEKCFVDYCDGLALVDINTGELIKTQLFVGCLGASSYTFAEATLTQKLPDWLMSHVRMYEFFEGVTEITVPDNLKSAVNKPCFYEPEINESYRDLSCHYNTAIIPAHVRKPNHKAKVEANVLVAQRWILACLRKKVFHTIQELNEAIRPLLEKLNNRQMRHFKKSRRELFLELDRPALRPLPPTRYEFAEWKTVKVNINYHSEFDEHFYAVHYTHVQKQLQTRATATVVELFLKGERIASHRRSYNKGGYTTPAEYMPESHKAMLKWPPSRLISWASSLGPSVGALVEKVLSSVKHPEQRYTSALGIIRLGKKYGNDRLETASRRALELGSHSYRFVADMLKNNMDKLIVTEEKNKQLTLAAVEEANTRGRGYYNKQTRH